MVFLQRRHLRCCADRLEVKQTTSEEKRRRARRKEGNSTHPPVSNPILFSMLGHGDEREGPRNRAQEESNID